MAETHRSRRHHGSNPWWAVVPWLLLVGCGPKKTDAKDVRKECLARATTDEAASACWNEEANRPVVGTWRMAGPPNHEVEATFTLDGRQQLKLTGPKGEQTKQSYFSLTTQGERYQMEVFDCRPGLPDCGGSPRQILALERSEDGRRLTTRTLESSGSRNEITVWNRVE